MPPCRFKSPPFVSSDSLAVTQVAASLAVTCGQVRVTSLAVTLRSLTCGHLRSLEWPRLLRSLAVTCGHSSAVTCGHLRSLEWPRVTCGSCGHSVAVSLAVTCGHSSGRVSCGLLRTLAVTRVAGLLRPLAVSCGHSSGRVSCGCGHLRSLEWPVSCGHLRSLEWLQVTAFSKIYFRASCVLNAKFYKVCGVSLGLYLVFCKGFVIS